jgi:hypothetical protein
MSGIYEKNAVDRKISHEDHLLDHSFNETGSKNSDSGLG